MLASLLARYHDQGERAMDRHAGWSAALRELRENGPGGINRLRDYLCEIPEDQRLDALQDIIAEHLRLTWQMAQGAHLEAYFAAFGTEYQGPGSTAPVPAALVEDEFLARHQLPHGDAPTLEEYRRRFPGRSDVADLLTRRYMDGGRYVKLHKRGLGAMGEVWEASDLHLRRLVAIKEPRAGLSDNSDALRRFAEEAMITAGLEHPGIVSVHEYHRADGSVPFYVMRLVKGESLGERIRDYHQPPAARVPIEQHLLWEQLLRALVMICDALSYAHGCGVLHLDLKPGNVVLGDCGEVVLLDWGMARRIPKPGSAGSPAALDTRNTLVGTPEYMSPEQANGEADVRSDVFGLGAILFETLTGHSPHGWTDGTRPADWSRLVQEANFERPRRVQPATPRALEAICMKALARDPAQRYQTTAELGRDLRCFLAGERVSVWDETRLGRTWRRLLGRR